MKKYIGFVILLIAFVCLHGMYPDASTRSGDYPADNGSNGYSHYRINSCTNNATNHGCKNRDSRGYKNHISHEYEGCHYHPYAEQHLCSRGTDCSPRTGITWINDDSAVHSVKTIGNATGMFNSGDILPGSQWSYTFGQREGRYEFTCSYHPEMKGAIIIKNP